MPRSLDLFSSLGLTCQSNNDDRTTGKIPFGRSLILTFLIESIRKLKKCKSKWNLANLICEFLQVH